MSSLYNVLEGDTFELVSRKVYGVETQSYRIQQANPGVVEPLQAGTVLVIPVLPGAPTDKRTGLDADSLGEVAIRIDGKRFRFWEGVRIRRVLDSFDTVEITAPFSVDLPGFRETFVPFTYKGIDVTVGGDLLFTGTMVSVVPDISTERKAIVAGGYSLPGVLNDCTPPASLFPLEFNEQNLQAIAETIAGTFGIAVEFEADPGPVFKSVTAEPGKKALGFLIDLAQQRNMVIGSTEAGAMLFRRPLGDGAPAANLTQGAAPLTTVSPSFLPQDYYSDITGIEPVFFGLNGSQYTIKNPRLSGVIRPLTFNTPDTESAAVVAAVESKVGRMFGNAASYNVTVSTIRDPAGNVWAPGSVVTLEAPDAMVYRRYPFTIRSAEIHRNRSKEFAVLNLILPGVFGGQTPGVLPWDA